MERHGSKGSRDHPWRSTTTTTRYGAIGQSYFLATTTAAVDPLFSANGYLAGLAWPPRSYNCSFCKREFRSAQALGGHMNVHRRDRARLRQTSPPPWESTMTNSFPSSVDHNHQSNGCMMPDLNLSPNHNKKYYCCCMPDLNVSPLPCCCTDATENLAVFNNDFPSSSSTLSTDTAVVSPVLPKDDVALKTPLIKANLDLELRLGFT